MADAVPSDVDALFSFLKQLSAPSVSPEPQPDLPGGGFSQDQASRWLAWRNARIQAQGLPPNVTQYMQNHEDYGEQNPPRQINPNAPPNQVTPPATIYPPSLDSRTGPTLAPQGPAQPPGYTEDWFHNYETNPPASYRQAVDIVQQQRMNGDRTAQLLQHVAGGQSDSTWNPAQTNQLPQDVQQYMKTAPSISDAGGQVNYRAATSGQTSDPMPIITGGPTMENMPMVHGPGLDAPDWNWWRGNATGQGMTQQISDIVQQQRQPSVTRLLDNGTGSPGSAQPDQQETRPPSIEDMFTPEQNYERNKAWAKAGPYATTLTPEQETQFRSWVTTNKVPFNPDEKTPDYDMRGFWMGLQNNDPTAKSAIDPNDARMHYPDYWKTPYDATFSAQSQWATPAAPNWKDDQLVLPSGAALYDDKSGRWLGPTPQKTGQ